MELGGSVAIDYEPPVRDLFMVSIFKEIKQMVLTGIVHYDEQGVRIVFEVLR
jgi:hypothetical protein